MAASRVALVDTIYSLTMNILPSSKDPTSVVQEGDDSNKSVKKDSGLMVMISQALKYQAQQGEGIDRQGDTDDTMVVMRNNVIRAISDNTPGHTTGDTGHQLWKNSIFTDKIRSHYADNRPVSDHTLNGCEEPHGSSQPLEDCKEGGDGLVSNNTRHSTEGIDSPPRVPLKHRAAVAWTLELEPASGKPNPNMSDLSGDAEGLPRPPTTSSQRKDSSDPSPSRSRIPHPPTNRPQVVKLPAERCSKWLNGAASCHSTLLYEATCPIRCVSMLRNPPGPNGSTAGDTVNQKDMNKFVVGTNDRSLLVLSYSATPNNPLTTHSSAVVKEYKDVHKGSVYCCDSISPDGPLGPVLIASGSNDKVVKLTRYDVILHSLVFGVVWGCFDFSFVGF